MFKIRWSVVGDTKPTHYPGSLEECIKLVPEGIGDGSPM